MSTEHGVQQEASPTNGKKFRPRQISPTQRLLPAREACRVYGFSYTTIRDCVHRGELAVIKIGRAWYFERADIDKWLESHRETAVA